MEIFFDFFGLFFFSFFFGWFGCFKGALFILFGKVISKLFYYEFWICLDLFGKGGLFVVFSLKGFPSFCWFPS